ncbi:MAG TPA: TRAP transporter small permease [Candidimonas sp.]|nr:TRAP transporter small permease [Candidimonas sp.]
MRRFLDGLYLVSGALAGIFTIGVLVAVSLSIITRQIGVYIPGLDAYAGYAMAAAGFLALAHTFKTGDHIRVTLVLAALSARNRMRLDIAALLVACLITASLAGFSCKLVLDSFSYNDVSTGDDATPLWIPQLAMAIGNIIFLISVLDETVRRMRGFPETVQPSETRYE